MHSVGNDGIFLILSLSSLPTLFFASELRLLTAREALGNGLLC